MSHRFAGHTEHGAAKATSGSTMASVQQSACPSLPCMSSSFGARRIVDDHHSEASKLVLLLSTGSSLKAAQKCAIQLLAEVLAGAAALFDKALVLLSVLPFDLKI